MHFERSNRYCVKDTGTRGREKLFTPPSRIPLTHVSHEVGGNAKVVQETWGPTWGPVRSYSSMWSWCLLAVAEEFRVFTDVSLT